MKKYLLYIVIFLIGAVAGMWLCRNSFRDTTIVQNDTVTVYKAVPYSPLELKANTIELDVPEINRREYVFVDITHLDTIYRDSIRYVTLPRQYYFTKVKDAEIWHSGVDSRIDSLNVLYESTNITQTYTPKAKKHSISLGIEANYSTSFMMPVQLEYGYKVKDWLMVYGYAEYELFMKQFGIGGGASLQIEW